MSKLHLVGKAACVLAASATLIGVGAGVASAATPATSSERTYSYIDGKGSPPGQHIEVPSWATHMVVQLTGGAGGGATGKEKPCKVAGGAGTQVRVDVDLATQGRDFDLYLAQQGTTSAFKHTGGILDAKSPVTTGNGGSGWQLVDRDGRRQVEAANGGSSTYGGGGGGSSLLTGSAGVVALAAGGGGAGSCGGDGTGINWYWNPGGVGGSNGKGAKGSEVSGLPGGAGAGGAFGGESTAAGGSKTSGLVAGGGAGGAGIRGGSVGKTPNVVDSNAERWAGYGGGGSGSSYANVASTLTSGSVGNGSAVVTFYD